MNLKRNNVKALRESRNISLEQLAEKTGANIGTLQKVEDQKIVVAFLGKDVIRKMAEVLECKKLELYYPMSIFKTAENGFLLVDNIFCEITTGGYVWGCIDDYYFLLPKRVKENIPVIDQIIPTQKEPIVKKNRNRIYFTDREYMYFNCERKGAIK